MGTGSSRPGFSACLPQDGYSELALVEEYPGANQWLAPVGDTFPEELKTAMAALRAKTVSTIESVDARLERYLSALKISVKELRVMTDSFVHELGVGLEAHQLALQGNPIPAQECSFRMLDACVKSMPNGMERGVFYAIDFGGTNLRVVRVSLNGDSTVSIQQHQASLVSAVTDLSEECTRGLLDSKATALNLFDFFAKTVRSFMIDQGDLTLDDSTNNASIGDSSACRRAGFTFSFPCIQRNINEAQLVCWTKGFETGRNTDDPIEGLDVAELLNVACRRNGVPLICNCVLNDTVGTMLSCAYGIKRESHPPCLVGLIVGTGVNCCYVEDHAAAYGYKGKVINVEAGNFNRDLPRTNIDCELDFKAVSNRGLQLAEKMCSGAYLGEICRVAFVKVFQHTAPAVAWIPESLTAEMVARIQNDSSPDLKETQAVLLSEWRVDCPRHQLVAMRRIATAVMDRSAAIAAVLIAGCARKTGRLQAAFGGLSVGIDGSLYKLNPWYRDRVRAHLDEILGHGLSSLIHLLQADDGSGRGAGILAGTLVCSGVSI